MTRTSAARFDTRGLPAEYYVDFGPTAAYGGRTAGVAIAGASGATALGATLTGLSPGTAYHYRVVAIGPDGASAGADRVLRTAPAVPATAASGTPRPRVLGLSVAPRAFAVLMSGRPAAVSRHRPARGARITVRLSRAAPVVLAIQRPAAGRRAAGRCVAPRARAAVPRAARCTRYLAVGTVRHPGRAGVNRFVLTGRIGATTLRPGAYRLEARATDVLGRPSAPVRVTFRVLSSAPAPRAR